MSAEKTPLEIIAAARELISDPKRWTRGAYARNEQGAACGARNPAAVCWCASGALIKCGGGAPFAGGISDALLELLKRECIVHKNDDEGHASVLAAFDRVLAAAA